MAATTAGAIKALVERAGLGVAVYRDAAPSGTAMPYVTVSDGLAVVADADGTYDRDVDHTVAETVSVDLWQPWRNERGGVAEDYTLARRLRAALHGVRLPDAPTRVDGVQVLGAVRLLEPEDNVVHDVVTVRVRRVQV